MSKRCRKLAIGCGSSLRHHVPSTPQLLQLRCVERLNLFALPQLLLAAPPVMATPRRDPAEINTVNYIRSQTKPKAKAKPLDFERAFPIGPCDPRSHQDQWPCMGCHTPLPPQGNQHGAWRHCAVCNVRVEYVPRVGSTGQNTKLDNPGMVRRMLLQLRDLLGDGLRPTAAICAAMMNKVDADEKLTVLIREHRQEQPLPTSTPTLTTSVTAPTPNPRTNGTAPSLTQGSPGQSSEATRHVTATEPTLQEAYAMMDMQN